jgi:cellulose synthase/poly-beta-1,6-N-acetylglucosamine synthase-like glycosyltransferase
MQVSVVTAVYNTGREVLETMDSISKNAFESMEHLILDDASTDDSVELIRGYIEAHCYACTLEVSPQNRGIAATRQALLERSRGTYYIGISDDRMRPERLKRSVEWMDAHPHVGVVFGLAAMFEHGTERPLGLTRGWQGPVLPDGTIDSALFARQLLHDNILTAMTTTIRREWLVRVGYDTSYLIEDYPLWFSLLKAGCKFAYVPEVWVDYRRTSNSVQIKQASRVALDSLRAKLILLDSGLVANEEVLRACWKHFWSKITVFETPHRRAAYRLLVESTPQAPKAALRGFLDYSGHFLQKRLRRPHALQR